MKTESHTHHRPQELAVFVIPADDRRQMGIQVIRNQLGPMQRICGGYITNVPSGLIDTPDLRCGCQTILMVNEEGSMGGRELLANPRASLMFRGNYPLCGDAFLIGRGPILSEDHTDDMDFLSLPQEFNRWLGPGHPVPHARKIERLAEKNGRR